MTTKFFKEKKEIGTASLLGATGGAIIGGFAGSAICAGIGYLLDNIDISDLEKDLWGKEKKPVHKEVKECSKKEYISELPKRDIKYKKY